MAYELKIVLSTDNAGHFDLNPIFLRHAAKTRSHVADMLKRSKFILTSLHANLPSKIERSLTFKTIVEKTFPCYDVLILALHQLWNKNDGLRLNRKDATSTVSYADAYLTCVEDSEFLDLLPITVIL